MAQFARNHGSALVDSKNMPHVERFSHFKRLQNGNVFFLGSMAVSTEKSSRPALLTGGSHPLMTTDAVGMVQLFQILALPRCILIENHPALVPGRQPVMLALLRVAGRTGDLLLLQNSSVLVMQVGNRAFLLFSSSPQCNQVRPFSEGMFRIRDSARQQQQAKAGRYRNEIDRYLEWLV